MALPMIMVAAACAHIKVQLGRWYENPLCYLLAYGTGAVVIEYFPESPARSIAASLVRFMLHCFIHTMHRFVRRLGGRNPQALEPEQQIAAPTCPRTSSLLSEWSITLADVYAKSGEWYENPLFYALVCGVQVVVLYSNTQHVETPIWMASMAHFYVYLMLFVAHARALYDRLRAAPSQATSPNESGWDVVASERDLKTAKAELKMIQINIEQAKTVHKDLAASIAEMRSIRSGGSQNALEHG